MGKPVVREVKILDAVLKEEDGTEDEPKVKANGKGEKE